MAIRVAVFEDNKLVRDSFEAILNGTDGFICSGSFSGCNYLIQHNKAILLTEARQLLDVMGWTETKKDKIKPQRTLFIELSADEQKIIDLLQQKETVHLDEINISSGLSSSAAAAAILNLELQNVVAALPGKLLKLL